MLILSHWEWSIYHVPSLSRRKDANSQLVRQVIAPASKSIKKEGC